jgi:hypothetical protein
MNRTEITRALAKSLAYREAGNAKLANQWAAELLRLLAAAGISPS